MKEFKRILAFVLTLVMLTSVFAYAEPKATTVVLEPIATIVSPETKSVVSSDSFLVSVRLNKQATIKVSVFEEKISERKVVTTYVSGSAVTKEAISYKSFDTTTFEAIDFVTNPAINSAVDFLFTTPAAYTSPKDAVGFYSTKIEDVKPGIYKVLVEVVEETKLVDEKTGKETQVERIVERTSSLICVKEKVEKEVTAFSPAKEKSSALTVISNFLKSLFK